MSLTSRKEKQIKRRLTAHRHSQENTYLQLTRNSSLSRSFSRTYNHSNRNTITQRPNQIRNKLKENHNEKQQKKIEDITKINQLNMKLLDTIHNCEKQIHKLRIERNYFHKEYETCKNKYLRKMYENCKPFFEYHPIQKQTVVTPIVETKQELSLDHTQDYQTTQITIQKYQAQNIRLKEEINTLKSQLSKKNTADFQLFVPLSNKESQTQDLLDEFIESPISMAEKSIGQAVLQQRISELTNYICDIERRHGRLKDRCKNIKNLITKTN